MPGRLYCSNHRTFGFEDLENPTGAEVRVGPEFDVLRSVIGNPPTREVARDEIGVTFLADRREPGPWEGGPYWVIDVRREAGVWKSVGYGDCRPRAYGPPGFGAATWTWDPAFRKPRTDDRVLHLLVHERACASRHDASGRLGPAYVIADQFEVFIEIIVQERPGGDDCQGNPITPARLSLSEPLGDRTLRDRNAHLLHPGSGG